MWPDWAIFEKVLGEIFHAKVAQMFGDYLGCFEKHCFKVKTEIVVNLVIFWKHGSLKCSFVRYATWQRYFLLLQNNHLPTESPVVNLIKHFTIVIYDSRVVWLGNCPCYDSRVVNYDRTMFIRLATGGFYWGHKYSLPLTPSQHHAGLQRAVFQLQQELTRHKAKFEHILPQ